MPSPEYLGFLDRGLQSEQMVAHYIATRHRCEVMRSGHAKTRVGDAEQAPLLLAFGVQIIAPDMLTWNKGVPLWVEVKDKDSCTWHRKSNRWQTGLNARHLRAYQQVMERTKIDVCVWFIHHGVGRDDDPIDLCQPQGVFTGRISALSSKAREHGGMVYWDMALLTEQCSLEALLSMRNVTMMKQRS